MEKTIKEVITKIFGDSKIYIFGSYLKKENYRDIDIFVIPNKTFTIREKRHKIYEAKNILEEKLLKPVDIVVHKDFNRDIEKEALKGKKIE
ncbi:nucleotidyltransferase family protein [Caminibacter sp.]